MVATEHFDNDIAGYVEATAWVADHGSVDRWAVENAASFGRHLAEFLVDDGADVQDAPPHRTGRRGRGRHEGKSDIVDSHRIAQETQAYPQLACAFERATPSVIDADRGQMAL